MVTLSAIQKGKIQTWQAQIVRTEGVVDERSRVTYAVATIEDPYGVLGSGNSLPLPMGTFVKASIQGDQFDNVIRVPRTALRGKNELMFIDNDSQLQIRAVTILRADQNYAYVREGATAGDRITITAIESPINGMKVRTSADVPEAEAVAGEEESSEDDSQVAQVQE